MSSKHKKHAIAARRELIEHYKATGDESYLDLAGQVKQGDFVEDITSIDDLIIALKMNRPSRGRPQADDYLAWLHMAQLIVRGKAVGVADAARHAAHMAEGNSEAAIVDRLRRGYAKNRKSLESTIKILDRLSKKQPIPRPFGSATDRALSTLVNMEGMAERMNSVRRVAKPYRSSTDKAFPGMPNASGIVDRVGRAGSNLERRRASLSSKAHGQVVRPGKKSR